MTSLCVRCRKHPAKFFYRGKVRADPKHQHDLCPACFRALENQRRALEMKGNPHGRPIR